MALSSTDIKIKLLERGVSIVDLAKRWKTDREIISRVINRHGRFVYPEIRRRLASYLGVPISEIGREPIRKQKRKAA